jgi:hypothetical protein
LKRAAAAQREAVEEEQRRLALEEENERRKQLEVARLNAKGPRKCSEHGKAEKKSEKQRSVEVILKKREPKHSHLPPKRRR